MEKQYNELKEKVQNLSVPEIIEEVNAFVNEVLDTDESLLSVVKIWINHGTWKSRGFANLFRFGEELSEILKKVLSSKITHDEEKQFEVEDFKDEIIDAIYCKITE